MRISARWRLAVLVSAAALWLSAPLSSARAAGELPDLSSCQPLEACIALLEKVIPAEDTGAWPRGAEVAAAQLSRFGEPAKVELLRRARGDNPGWRNYAGAILASWPSWLPEDVPALAAALRRDPGGWMARPLLRIGDDRAIDALIDDLPRAGGANQTTFALTQLAPRSLAKLLPLLELPPRSEGALAATSLIEESKGRVRSVLPDWTAIALDGTQPAALRIAALRGIGAAGPEAIDQAALLRPLLNNPDKSIASEVREVLLASGDQAVAAEAVNACAPANNQLASFNVPERSFCVIELARFRRSLSIVGPRLLQFAASPNGGEAALAINMIAALDYKPAESQLVAGLSSSDWRVAYASAQALGALGLPDAIPALEKTSQTYWLPEVRDQARQSATVLRAGGHSEPVRGFGPTISDLASQEEVNRPCPGWTWRGQTLRVPNSVVQSIRLPTGTLTAIDQGEWGGGLTWSPRSGKPQTLVSDNVRSLEPIEGGVLALGGLAHLSFDYGYVVRVRLNGTAWDVREIVRLPNRFDAITSIGPQTYAAWSFKRVVIFSEDGILGMAACQR
jgi:hypothetical protein